MKKISLKILMLVLIFIALQNTSFAQQQSKDRMIVVSQIVNLSNNLFKDVPQKKATIAVLPFETNEGRPEAHGLGEAASILINKTLLSKKEFTVVERKRIQNMLEEISLSMSGLTESEHTVGQMLKADYLVAGAVADLGSRILIAARLINIQSGNILKLESIEVPASNFLSVSNELVPVKRYPITAAARSMVLPGWGQFYNESPVKGSILMGAEMLLAGGAISSYVLYKQSKDSYDRATNGSIAGEKFDEMGKYKNLNWASLGLMGAVWLYAVLDAYIESNNQINEFQRRRTLSKNTSTFYFFPDISKEKVMIAVQMSF